jgi:hypothetical protein
LNQRPPAPKAGALPSCATPRDVLPHYRDGLQPVQCSVGLLRPADRGFRPLVRAGRRLRSSRRGREGNGGPRRSPVWRESSPPRLTFRGRRRVSCHPELLVRRIRPEFALHLDRVGLYGAESLSRCMDSERRFSGGIRYLDLFHRADSLAAFIETGQNHSNDEDPGCRSNRMAGASGGRRRAKHCDRQGDRDFTDT